MMKVLMEVGMHGMYYNIIQPIEDKIIANIVVNGEKQKPFPLHKEMMQEFPLSVFLFDTLLELLATAVKQEKEKKGYRNRKRRGRIAPICIPFLLYI